MMKNLLREYENCRLCPEACGVDRTNDQRGRCRMPDKIIAATAVLHKGEEPPLVGDSGSGVLFFSGCTLGCPFCQNVQISCDGMGAQLTEENLSEIFLTFQSRGAANLNLVTATQFTPSVIAAVASARSRGLWLPVVWNSSGYETPKTVKMLSETVDIWLPDIKTLSREVAGRLFGSSKYPKAAAAALTAMARQLDRRGGTLIEDGLMKRGMIIRHLVMPGELESSLEVFEWYARNFKNKAMLSVMVQYTPVNEAGAAVAGPGYIMPDEDYDQLLEWLDELGIEEGFLQSPEAASSDWIPDFTKRNPFPEEYSETVWSWKD